jgi:hypothetical protein
MINPPCLRCLSVLSGSGPRQPRRHHPLIIIQLFSSQSTVESFQFTLELPWFTLQTA